jgi:ABC-type antimicrobial peptide transport system permease subunit
MPVQYVCGICRSGIVIFYVAEVLLISCGYRSTGLSYVGVFTHVAFELIYSTGVGNVDAWYKHEDCRKQFTILWNGKGVL